MYVWYMYEVYSVCAIVSDILFVGYHLQYQFDFSSVYMYVYICNF